jgi:hypothetical protein
MSAPAATPTTAPAEPEKCPGFAELNDDAKPVESRELDEAA